VAHQQPESAAELEHARADAPARIGIAARHLDVELGPVTGQHHHVGQHHDVAGQEVAARAAQLIHGAAHPRVLGAIDYGGDERVEVAVPKLLGEALRLEHDGLVAVRRDDARGAEVDAAEHRHHRDREHEALQEREPCDRRARKSQ
jgi:hypothetical protein